MLTNERTSTRTDTGHENSNALVRPFVNYSTGLLILRVILGIVFIAHGGQKVFGWFGGNGLEATAGFFSQSFGLPIFMGYLVAFTELFGGIALIIGLLTKLAALGIFAVMMGAIFMVHLSAGFFNPQGYEFPLTLAVIALTIMLLGPGTYSLDDKLFNRRK